MPTFRISPFFPTRSLHFCPFFPAHTLRFRPLLTAVAATVSAVKVIGQQLRYSEDGQHDSDVRCTFKVL